MTIRMDPDAVREAWDFAADGYAGRQATGRDPYRYAFFGPAQIAMCGDVAGTDLLDVGCGAGYFAREMAAGGAHVTGIDISPKLIAHARALAGGVDYEVLDAAQLAARFPPAAFDFATACLAMQDLPDPATAFRDVFTVLRPGGRFVLSISHPCSNPPQRAWERDEHGGKRWLCIDRYFERGAYACEWRYDHDFVTPWRHAPLEDWFAWIVAAGFQIAGVREPRRTEETLAAFPDLADAARVPYYVLFDVRRP